jgi:hypothetical protein
MARQQLIIDITGLSSAITLIAAIIRVAARAV